MTEKTVSFKMPADEVRELDEEADAEDKTRSAYIRSVLRSRHIEEQLEEQVLTKQDQREYEQRIAELKEERDGYYDDLQMKKAKIETMETTIDKTVDEGIEAVRDNYREQIGKLRAENDQLRKSLEELTESVVTESDLDDHRSRIISLLEDHSQRQWETATEQRELLDDLIMDLSDEIVEETVHSRSPLTKFVDWIRGHTGRLNNAHLRGSDQN